MVDRLSPLERLRSLRLRAALVATLIAVSPLLMIFAWRWLIAGSDLELAELRQILERLVLLLLPPALLLAWWLGWRMMRPIDRLRAQLLAKTSRAAAGARAAEADIDLGRGDEFGDLARSLNELLRALD
jgi:methyl-accepting chemotaxis protein